MSDYCLNLLCPRAAEEHVVDTLLAIGETGVFASVCARAHGLAPNELSTSEQVSGRSGATLVQALVSKHRLPSLVVRLHGDLARSGVRFWITPVIQHGAFE
ncbi:MAG TPA: DUF3240 family protein [Paraburkholderia sp.]|jgi:hypothetical protein|nr:DUF3240 family protein [Paraburkholderia sp.]